MLETRYEAGSAEWYDCTYREAGLREMAPVVIRYDHPGCPHGCGLVMEWIAFNLDATDQASLIRAWWDGSGIVGGCPSCGRPIRFRTVGMEALADASPPSIAALPEDWAERATFGAATAAHARS